MKLEDIGEKAFSFAFLYALLSSIVTIALVSSGIQVPSTLRTMYLPTTFFASYVADLRSKLPTDYMPADVFVTIGATTAVAAIVQFIFSLLFSFIALIMVFTTIIPPQCSFLIPVLYFVGSFLQGMVWYYVFVKIFSKLRTWII